MDLRLDDGEFCFMSVIAMVVFAYLYLLRARLRQLKFSLSVSLLRLEPGSKQ